MLYEFAETKAGNCVEDQDRICLKGFLAILRDYSSLTEREFVIAPCDELFLAEDGGKRCIVYEPSGKDFII